MGSNHLWTQCEAEVIRLYNLGVLTLPVLDEVCNQYAGTDIDSGGSMGLETKDGKFFEQVCIELVEPEFAPIEDEEDPWDWHEEFGEIKAQRWDWR